MAKFEDSKITSKKFLHDTRLYDLLMQAPALISVMREPGHIFEFANDLYLEIAGKTNAIIGKPILEVFPELKQQGTIRVLDEVYKTGRLYQGKGVNFKFDALNNDQPQDRYFDYVCLPARDSSGKVTSIFVHATEITKQVFAREQAEQNEDQYKTLFNSIDQGFCIIKMIYDDDGRPIDYEFIEVNRIFEEQTGLKNPVGKTAHELVPDLEGHWFETYGNVVKTGEPARFSEGSVQMGRWFDVLATRLGAENNQQVAILFTDVTERKISEKQLIESESYYREMADSTPTITWVSDETGSCTYLNKQWYSYTGQTETEALGIGWTRAIHPKESKLAGKTFMEASAKRRPYTIEFQLRAADGTYRWVVDKGLPKFSSTGDFEGYVGSVIDIHKRKLAENALRSQLLLTEAITNNTTLCLFMVDIDGVITFMNPAAVTVTGFTPDEAIGISIHNLIHHTHPDGSVYTEEQCARFNSYKNGIGSEPIEDLFFRKDGSAFPALINGMPVAGDKGATSTVIEFRDISLEKQASQRIARSLARENKLQKAAVVLQARSDELVALNLAKDEFINLASHQLRTPATGVKQYIGMILEGYAGEIPESLLPFLTTAYSSNERQLRIVDNLLKVARVDSGQVQLHKQEIDLVPLITDIINEQSSNFKTSNQEINFIATKPEVYAVIDANLFRMVIENLVDNAHKYTYHGKRVEVGVAKMPDGVRLTVRDEGIGIDPNDMDKLFKKFSRLDNELSIEVGGTGLGLYWSKRIIDLHGGTVAVQSKPGNGTTFTVMLP
ncbi:PAS domain S-box protein [Candidatus Saccharibacteria bacterium]|nr:PAS domain S-box protein [Candidatus Saccharibacteria bacterium]